VNDLINVFNLESIYIHAVQGITYMQHIQLHHPHRMFPGLLTGRTRASPSMGDAMERAGPVRSIRIVLASSLLFLNRLQ
jgi:hypothetical protein